MTANALSSIGRRDLAKHEATIQAHLKTFFQVGDALMAIRDGKLYREDFATFEDYCRSRWKFSARRARQLISGAESGTTVPISNERQARALGPLKGDEKAQQEVVEAASQDGPPTAKKIAAEVAKRVPAIPTSGSSESEAPASDAAGRDVDVQEPPPVPSPAPNAAPIDTTAREEFAAKVERDVIASERERLAGVIEEALSEFDCVGGKPWDEVALVAVDALIAAGEIFPRLEAAS